MITTKLQHLHHYLGIHKNLDMAIHYIQQHDLSSIPMGSSEIDGKNVYVNHFTYTTACKEDGFLEAHGQYLDIHVVLEGEEYIGYCDMQHTQELQPYVLEEDFYKVAGTLETLVYMNNENACITWLEDAHQPKIKVNAPCEINKLVFKVKIK